MIDFACKQFDIKEVVKCSLALTRADLEVFELMLSSPGKRMSSDEIARRLKINLSTSQRAVKKLHEKNMVRRLQVNLVGGGYAYEYQLQDKAVMKREILSIVHNWTAKVEHELSKL